MKKNLFSWGVMGMFAMLCACNSAPKGYTVSGTLPDSTMNGQTLYILNVDNSECVDSTVVEGNAYLFEGHVDTALCLYSLWRMVALRLRTMGIQKVHRSMMN